jgi:hypothetical protein
VFHWPLWPPLALIDSVGMGVDEEYDIDKYEHCYHCQTTSSYTWGKTMHS